MSSSTCRSARANASSPPPDIDPNLLGPWAGLGITALYCIAALLAGAIALQRRDA
jgi:hypothetical protein